MSWLTPCLGSISSGPGATGAAGNSFSSLLHNRSLATTRRLSALVGLPERSDARHPRERATLAVLLVSVSAGASRREGRRDGRSPGGLRQAVEAEEANVVTRDPGLRQVGHDLAYHASELVTVPRARRGERDLLVVGVQVDDEVVVGRVGEHAGLEVHRRPAAIREVPLGELAQQLLVVIERFAVEGFGVDEFFQVVVLAELEARDAEDGEAVEAPLVHEQVEDGEDAGPEALGAGWLEPRQHLPLGHGEAIQHVEKLPVPGPG